MPIFIDSRGDGEADITKLLQQRHIPVERKFIESGDYVFGEVAIERKSIADLVSSVSGPTRHFWEQLRVMKDTYKKPILLVEGKIDWNDKIVSGILYAVIGGWSIPFINTMNQIDSADKISKLFDKYGPDAKHSIMPAVVKKEKSAKWIKWAMLQCVYGIGATVAKRIMEVEPLTIGTPCNIIYLEKKLSKVKGLTKESRKRLMKVLMNDDT